MACFPKVSEHYFQIPLSQPSITKLSWWDRMTNNPGPVPISSMHQNGFIEECTSDDGISSNQCLLCILIKLNFFFNLLFGNPIGIHVFMDRPTSEANKQQKPVFPNFYWTSLFFQTWTIQQYIIHTFPLSCNIVRILPKNFIYCKILANLDQSSIHWRPGGWQTKSLTESFPSQSPWQWREHSLWTFYIWS